MRFIDCAIVLTLAAGFGCTTKPKEQEQEPPRDARKAILIVLDGFRADMLNETDSPAMFALAQKGTRFTKNHSVFPCTTLTNAGAIATGSYAQKSSWWGEKFYIPSAEGTDATGAAIDFSQVVDTRDWGTLKAVNDAYNGNLLTAGTLFKAAKAKGMTTAAIGKAAATFIQDLDFPTYLLDTDIAAPAAFAQELMAKGYGVPPNTPKLFPEIVLAADYMNPYARSRARIAMQDGITPDPTSPNAKANTDTYAYFVKQYVEFILPEKNPDLTLMWIAEPDGAMHTYGIGSQQYKDALKNVDGYVAQIVAKVEEMGQSGITDIILTSDHGGSTVSGHLEHFPLRAMESVAGPSGTTVSKPGAVDPSGYSVSGQVLLAELLKRGGFNVYNTATCISDPTMSGVLADGSKLFTPTSNTAVCPRSYTSPGYALPPFSALPDDAVMLMETGNGDFIYIPTRDPVLVQRVVRFLQELQPIEAVFVNSEYGQVPGTLSMTEVLLESVVGSRSPDIAFSYWTDSEAKVQGVAGIGYHNRPLPFRGDHGAMSPLDINISGFAVGPDFNEGFTDDIPTANVDWAPTLAHLLGLDPAVAESWDGRIVYEALKVGTQAKGRPASDFSVVSQTLTPAAPAVGLAVKKPTNPNGTDIDASQTTFSLELYVTTVQVGDKSYRYIDSVKGIRK